MKTLKFRYAGAWNFLPFGPDGIEIYFDDYGQVVLITGENLDTGTDKNPASNGTGKSSLQDILSYALYGQTVKRPKKLDHGKIINKTTGEKLLVEVQFDDYRIVRGREPNKLDVWCSKDHIWDKTTRVTKGSTGETQKFIEGIIGLSHTAFCNVVVFDDSNSYSFLELDAAGKRLVIESLLGLDRYRLYQESAKEVVKEHKTKIRDLTRDMEHIQRNLDDAGERITKVQEQEKNWVRIKQGEVDSLRSKLAARQKALASSDTGAGLAEYKESQQKAVELGQSIESLKLKRAKVTEAIKDARSKLQESRSGLTEFEDQRQRLNLECQRLNAANKEATKRLSDLAALKDGTKCPTCNGIVAEENQSALIRHFKNVVTASKAGFEKESILEADFAAKILRRREFLKKMDEMIADSEKKEAGVDVRIRDETKEMNRLLSLPRPEVGEVARALEAEIVAIKKNIEEKQSEIDGISPYKEILEQAQSERREKLEEIRTKTEELSAQEELLPYREWWVDAFGDKGIRKHLVDKVIPALNSRTAYWLQYLIDSKIQLTFDSELNETITRNGVDAYYHAMSNGEKRRINLAVSQAFAYVMMLNSGHCPSIAFLDEVTGGGIDTAGVTGIYNMIYELAKERQVLVTTHNQALLRMLDGCESIKLVKKGDVTTLTK